VTAAKWSAQGRDAKGRPVTFSGTATIVFARRKDFGLDIWVHTWN
jgi:ketosteroid isomerase-like protein